jgi:hypothetical protein
MESLSLREAFFIYDVINKGMFMDFKKWVDEYFFNSSVDLEILRKAFNALVSEDKKIESLDDIIE